MTWTYSGDPSASSLDEVRFLIGDTDSTDPLISNEEIAYALAQEANALLAAARICRAISATYARKADKSVGDLHISFKQSYDNYLALASELESRGNMSSAMPYAGGISVSDKNSVDADTDRVRPSIRKGMHDNPSDSDDRDINQGG